MKNLPKLVWADDWEGLYINDKLVLEDHRLLTCDVLNALGIEYETHNADDEWMYTVGRLPKKFKDVKIAKDED